MIGRNATIKIKNLIPKNIRVKHSNYWIALIGLFAAACANTPASKSSNTSEVGLDTDSDPYVSFNRPIWEFDITLDRYFLKPISIGYRWATPQLVQSGVVNALNNLKSPEIFMNDVLQGNMDRAGQTAARVAINSIFGLGGLVDVAAKKIPFHDADFGQTLGAWGVESGPYLVLPLLGPSDPRDAIGDGVDSFADPFGIEVNAYKIHAANYIRTGLGLISDRAETIDALDDVQKTSLDFYAAVRSLYQQHRAAKVSAAIHDGADITPELAIDVPDSETDLQGGRPALPISKQP